MKPERASSKYEVGVVDTEAESGRVKLLADLRYATCIYP